MLSLNTESLKRPFTPQEELPQAQKKRKINGENEHVEPSPLNAHIIEMLADEPIPIILS